MSNNIERAIKMLEIAKSFLKDAENGYNRIFFKDLEVIRKAITCAFFAYGFAIDALVILKTGRRPSGHHERIKSLDKINRIDLKEEYMNLLIKIYSPRMDTFIEFTGYGVRRFFQRIKDLINEIENEIKNNYHL